MSYIRTQTILSAVANVLYIRWMFQFTDFIVFVSISVIVHRTEQSERRIENRRTTKQRVIKARNFTMQQRLLKTGICRACLGENLVRGQIGAVDKVRGFCRSKGMI